MTIKMPVGKEDDGNGNKHKMKIYRESSNPQGHTTNDAIFDLEFPSSNPSDEEDKDDNSSNSSRGDIEQTEKRIIWNNQHKMVILFGIIMLFFFGMTLYARSQLELK
jgi:hypothetical protein